LKRALKCWNKKEKGTKKDNKELSWIAGNRNLERELNFLNKKKRGQ
jgi:hypothetical protein